MGGPLVRIQQRITIGYGMTDQRQMVPPSDGPRVKLSL